MGFTIGRCKYYACIANSYQPFYFFSKYPEKVSPIFNLVYLFSPLVWGLTFISLLVVVFLFTFSSWIYSKLGFREHISEEEILLYPFRVRVMLSNISTKNFDIGFSSTFAFLVWSIWGGFILHMLLSNYLAVLTQPTYEKPIRTLDDLLASSKNVFTYPDGGIFLELYAEFDDPKYTEMASRMYLSKDDDHLVQLIKELHSKNNDVYLSTWLDESDLEYGFWYRSKSLP